MSGVALRCPNCGTGRQGPGECEACHEAQVRYYCGNHTPGLWLDGAACPRCGARFGEQVVAAPARAPASHPAAPAPRRPHPVPAPHGVEAGPWGRGATPRAEHAPAEEALPRVVMGFGGCLLRLVLLVVLLFLASFGGMLLFAGSVFRIF